MRARRLSSPFASPAPRKSGPTRTPVLARRAEHRNDPLQRQPRRCDLAAMALRNVIAVGSIVTIVAAITARAIPPAQIPIARRHS